MPRGHRGRAPPPLTTALAQRASKDTRAEQADAQRTIGALLRDSMAHEGVVCIAVPGDAPGAPTRYVRALRPSSSAPGARRCVVRSLKTVEDVLALVEDVGRHMVSVSAEQLPDAVAKLVLARAREPVAGVAATAAAPTAPPVASLRFVKRPRSDERVVPLDVAPRETRHLTQQYAKACEERGETRARRMRTSVLQPSSDGRPRARYDARDTTRALGRRGLRV